MILIVSYRGSKEFEVAKVEDLILSDTNIKINIY